MADPPSLPPTAQTATASDLVRHFGDWQRRAAIAPVYILHHRRPQFVLASIEFLQALAAGSRSPGIGDVARALDALAEPVLLVAADGAILAAGRAARLCLGERVRPGARLDDVLDPDDADRLRGILRRVIASGLCEATELLAAGETAWLALTVEPHPPGALIVGRAAGVEAQRDAAQARADALARAVAALPNGAVATIDPRGRLTPPNDSLARLTGRTPDGRAAALFSEDTRAGFERALDTVFAGLTPGRLEAKLLTDRAAMPVAIGLAPLRTGAKVSAAVAVVTSRG